MKVEPTHPGMTFRFGNLMTDDPSPRHPMTTRADQLHQLARSYVTEALGQGDFDAIPYSEDVTLRAPLCPGGSAVPLNGRSNLREQWWAPLPQLVAGVEVLDTYVNRDLTAWKGTDEDRILNYYSEDVVLELPTGRLIGQAAVRDQFVRPFISAFPGNVHAIQNLAHAPNLVVVEWNFEAMHRGTFADLPATGRHVRLSGCSFYEHDLEARLITAGRIYFDLSTLLRQLGASA